MISNKLSSKKVIRGIIVLAAIVMGITTYVFLSKRSTENTNQPITQPTNNNTTSVPQEEIKSMTDNTQISKDFVSTNSFTYSKNDQLFTISEKEFKVLDKFNVANLVSESKECGTNKEEQYFKNILSKYSIADKGVEYSFKYKGKSQDSGVWKVTVVPNKIGYTGLDSFKNDFDLCRAGAGTYPTLVSEKWLLFESSCGTGFDDNSGNPHGCDAVQQAVGPTITLK